MTRKGLLTMLLVLMLGASCAQRSAAPAPREPVPELSSRIRVFVYQKNGNPSTPGGAEGSGARHYATAMRDRVSAVWASKEANVRNSLRGWKMSDKEPFALVRADILPSGSLRDAEVISTSGVEMLDRAALEAVKEAAPFPPPSHDFLTTYQPHLDFGFSLRAGGRR